jgi:hypothetical protein
MYFANFPIIPYDSVGNGDFKLVTNLLKRVAVRTKVRTRVCKYKPLHSCFILNVDIIASVTAICSTMLL